MFQLTDIPRILPELMLLVLALLVLGSDVFERWGTDAAARLERTRAAAQLTAIGLGLIMVVVLVQSRLLFQVPEPGGNALLDIFINLGRNLQAGGPGGSPILSAFATDDLTMIARLLLIGAALVVVLFSFSYQPIGHPGEFYALLLMATLGMCVMAAATELILAFVGLELSSIALYVLAGYFKSDRRSAEAGLKYFLFGVISSAVLLYGMSLAYGFTASVNAASGAPATINTLFRSIGEAARVTDSQQRGLVMLAMLLIVAGIGYKITVVPFHSWVADVYEGAPTAITAFLATASKAAGFLLLYRLLTIAFAPLAGTPQAADPGGWTALLALLALVTLVAGNLLALPQESTRRLLAYSSIGHSGFILLAFLSFGATDAIDRASGGTALLFYLVVYALTNLAAFGVLTAFINTTGSDTIEELAGLGQRNQLLAILLTIAVASLAGLPPLAGFWAKFIVFMAAWQAGAIWLVVIALAMTVVSLAYYLRLLRPIWMQPATEATPIVLDGSLRGALLVTAALVLLLGLLPAPLWQILAGATVVAAP
ncbi:MAG TPA: NADH-quinone oxidoreductase subunit N [Roseiflexaceae bacterium]|nr:NADH-quinone oxidoreductase subunit N [Roseiflexaceae bacterium]